MAGVTNIQVIGGEDGVLVPAARGLRFRTPFTVTHVPETISPGMTGNEQSVRAYNEVAMLPLAPFLEGQDLVVASLSIGSQTPPQYSLQVGEPQTTVDDSTLTLGTVPVPAGDTVDFEIVVIAVLGPGEVNANLAPTVYRLRVSAARVGSGSATVPGNNDTSDVSAPFVALENVPTVGTVNVTASGSNILVQATGFGEPVPWESGHAYVRGDGNATPGDFVTANGNVYLCTTSGTSSGSAPSGTGRGLGTGAKFDYVAAGAEIPIRWTLTKRETRTG